MEFPLDKGPRPPLHISCRCALTPVLDAKFAAFGKGAQRASRGAEGGAPVAGTLTYFDWLSDQPASFQDQAIGKTRGALLRSGDLTATEFGRLQVDKNFAPITLDRMREIDPIAFKKAGIQ
jgi:hypothetical protein